MNYFLFYFLPFSVYTLSPSGRLSGCGETGFSPVLVLTGLVLSHIGQNKRGAPPWAIKGRGECLHW